MGATYRVDVDWDGDGGLTRLADWSRWAPVGAVPPNIGPSTVRSRTGGISLLITWGAGGALPGAVYNPAPLIVGVEYTASAWFWVPAGSKPVDLVINGLPGLDGFSGPTTVTDQWQQRSVTWVATDTTHLVAVWPSITTTGGEQVWVADPTIQIGGEDITDRVLDRGSLSIQYGRDQARALAPSAAGEATLEVDNQSRDYSPENTSSPLAGHVLPGRTVRATADLGGQTYGLFYGHLDAFDVLPGWDRRSVQLSCLDPLGRLKDTRIYTEVYKGIQAGDAVHRILDAVGWPSAQRDIDRGATTIRWWWEDDTDAYDALMRVVDSEGPGALVSVDERGRVIFRGRHHRLQRAESLVVQATISDDDEPAMSALVYDHGWRDIVNSVTFSVPVRVQANITTVWSAPDARAITDGETVVFVARASDPFISAIPPVEGTDFTLLQGSVEVSMDRTSGQSAGIYIRAVGGQAVIADLSLRASPITTATTLPVIAEDSTSIQRYGRRSLPSARDPVWAGYHDAVAVAELIVAQRSERLPTVRATMRGAGNDDRLVVQLGLDLSGRARIVDAETGLDRDFFVERIEHRITAGQHETVFGCEAVPIQPVNALVLGSGQLGVGSLGRQGLDDPGRVFVLGSGANGVLGVNLLGL